MQIRLRCNAAGDLRLTTATDCKEKGATPEKAERYLVRCPKLRELKKHILRAYKAGFGVLSNRHPISKEARSMVREAGAIVDQSPKENTVFLTGTLPGDTPEAKVQLGAWSGWVVEKIQGWLRYHLPGMAYFGVWEYQGRGALHIHLCVRTNSQEDARWLIDHWKGRWIAILTKLCVRANCDLFARSASETWLGNPSITRTDAQVVKKSVSRYLSKYLSKGSLKRKAGHYSPPSAWSFVSAELRRAVFRSRLTVVVPQLTAGTSLDLFERLGGLIAGRVARTFPYFSPYEGSFKGLIALAEPSESRSIFDFIASQLRCLQGVAKQWLPTDVIPLRVISNLFNGRWLELSPSG